MWTKRKESLTVLGCLAYELAIFELYLVGKQEFGGGGECAEGTEMTA